MVASNQSLSERVMRPALGEVDKRLTDFYQFAADYKDYMDEWIAALQEENLRITRGQTSASGTADGSGVATLPLGGPPQGTAWRIRSIFAYDFGGSGDVFIGLDDPALSSTSPTSAIYGFPCDNMKADPDLYVSSGRKLYAGFQTANNGDVLIAIQYDQLTIDPVEDAVAKAS